MRLVVAGIPACPGFFVLRSILPVVVGSGVALSCEHHRARTEEERLVGDCSSGSPCLFLCILEHTNILGDPLYFEVIALHLIMQRQEVEGMETCAPHLEVGEKLLWSDVGVERLCVSKFLHPRILSNGEDELLSLWPRRLVGAAVDALGLVRRFCARADNGCGIVIDCRVVVSNACGFGKLRAIVRCLHCHRPNESNGVVCAPRFVVRNLEEERRHDLPYSREVGV